MSGIIQFAYNPGQSVWVIEKMQNCNNSCSPSNDSASAVREGVVIRVRAELLITTIPVMGSPLVYDNATYDIRIGQNAGTINLTENDVFETLGDAIAAYQARLA